MDKRDEQRGRRMGAEFATGPEFATGAEFTTGPEVEAHSVDSEEERRAGEPSEADRRAGRSDSDDGPEVEAHFRY